MTTTRWVVIALLILLLWAVVQPAQPVQLAAPATPTAKLPNGEPEVWIVVGGPVEDRGLGLASRLHDEFGLVYDMQAKANEAALAANRAVDAAGAVDDGAAKVQDFFKGIECAIKGGC